MNQVVFLISLFWAVLATAYVAPQRTPQSLPQEEQEYALLEGTQNCPQNITVKKTCRGWMLQDDQENSYPFCNANLEVQKKNLRESFGLKLIFSETEHTDSYLRSLVTTVITSAEGQAILEEENALFWSPEGEILWENRKAQDGMSCLYAQSESELESDSAGSDSLVSSL